MAHYSKIQLKLELFSKLAVAGEAFVVELNPRRIINGRCRTCALEY